MRVSIFDQYGALNSAPVFAAIRAGLDRLGIAHTSMDSSADVAVIWSMLWSGRMQGNQAVWQAYRNSGRPVIVVEVGMIRRGHTWKLGINGTGNDSYPGSNMDSDRAKRLGIKLQPWQQGNNIVIAVQRADSEQWAGQPPVTQWVQTTVDTIRKHTSRPIVIRSHPRVQLSIPGVGVERPKKIPGSYDDYDFEQTLKNAWAVVNWNSGPGPQSVIAGVPAFVGPNSLAAPVANLDLSMIETPHMPDRTQWINQLAHTEWTTQELATGLPIKRLLGI
jgi:hypothetical protein